MSRPDLAYHDSIQIAIPGGGVTAYAAGDLVGGKITLTGVAGESGTGELLSVILSDLDNRQAAFDVIFFDSNPTATTFTDNDPFDIDDADLPRICGVAKVVAGDYSAFVDNCVASKGALDIGFQATSEDLYAAIVTRGTPTYAAGALRLTVSVRQDG